MAIQKVFYINHISNTIETGVYIKRLEEFDCNNTILIKNDKYDNNVSILNKWVFVSEKAAKLGLIKKLLQDKMEKEDELSCLNKKLKKANNSYIKHKGD